MRRITIFTFTFLIFGLFSKNLLAQEVLQAQTQIQTQVQANGPVAEVKVDNSNLESLLVADNIGKNYRKLGKILGKSVSTNGRNRNYIVDGCKVKLWVFRNEGRINPQYDGIIEAIEVEISPVCTFDFTKVFPSLAPQKTANQIIIKDISRKETEFYNKCFLECAIGQQARSEFRYGLMQIDGYLAIDFIVDNKSDPKINEISATLNKLLIYDNAKTSDEVNCKAEYNQTAIRQFSEMKIDAIRFGMEDMDREDLPSCKKDVE
jgi:hypothetical protein